MRVVLFLLALLLASGARPDAAAADTYTLDKDHTEVRFSWDHLGLSRQSGRFRDLSGTVEFDPDRFEQAKADIIIRADSISTGVAALDEHLKTSKDFFDMVAHPAISFHSTSVKRITEKTAEMIGDLSINGQVRPVVLNVLWNFTGEHPLSSINANYTGKYSSGFSATTQILRSDWGITRTIPYVSDELRISIETEMHRTP